MSDEAPLSREQMNRFLEKIKEPFNEAEQQKRRSVEVSAGFFGKIAALSAGSTAILASLILAIANKYNIHTGWAQIVVHQLICIAFALGASLILAVLHIFLQHRSQEQMRPSLILSFFKRSLRNRYHSFMRRRQR